jgi:hypothetical protein
MTSSNALGLPNFDRNLSFDEIFSAVLAPLLVYRAEGFRTIFKNLRKPPLIVETGCLRAPGSWSGDGQSTFLFDLFASKHGGSSHSIDMNAESIAKAKIICPNTKFYLGDGATVLHTEHFPHIDLLYLDSFDAFRDVSVIPAPVHYMLEFCAAWPVLRPGSLIAIDDIHCQEAPKLPPTKGMGVGMFLEKVGAEILHDDYMKVWRLR